MKKPEYTFLFHYTDKDNKRRYQIYEINRFSPNFEKNYKIAIDMVNEYPDGKLMWFFKNEHIKNLKSFLQENCGGLLNIDEAIK